MARRYHGGGPFAGKNERTKLNPFPRCRANLFSSTFKRSSQLYRSSIKVFRFFLRFLFYKNFPGDAFKRAGQYGPPAVSDRVLTRQCGVFQGIVEHTTVDLASQSHNWKRRPPTIHGAVVPTWPLVRLAPVSPIALFVSAGTSKIMKAEIFIHGIFPAAV